MHDRPWRVTRESNLNLVRLKSGTGHALALPPKHQLEPGPVGIGSRNPLLQQLKMGRKALPQFVARGSERRTVAIGDQVIDGQVIPTRFEPPEHASQVIFTLLGINGAEQGVLENPIE